MKKDYSEYTLSDNEKYNSIFQNNQYIRYDFFQNTAKLTHDEKLITLGVDSSNEFHDMKDLIDEFERAEATRYYIKPEVLTQEEIDDNENRRIDELAKNEAICDKFKSKFKIEKDEHMNFFYSENPDIKRQPLDNVLSGAKIFLEYGEGILDFIYADFYTSASTSLSIYKFFHDEKEKQFIEHPPDKVYDRTDMIVDLYFNYTSTMATASSIIYSSLYTAICPPVFQNPAETYIALKQYITYITNLQNEYRELFEFCFDEAFYPDVLGSLYPSERYYLYKQLHSRASFSRRTEILEFKIRELSGEKMPYGLPISDIIKRIAIGRAPNDAEISFAEKYNTDPERLQALLKVPRFINIKYEFSTVEKLLELEFTKLLEHNMRFRKCKRCDKYFIMKGNYDTNYCDQIADGETRNCQELAAQENYKNKIADNRAIPLYSKYYKRYAARVRSMQIKETDFKKWKYQALTKRDECSDGKITLDEFTQWMEDSFPNRKSKK